MEVGNSSRKIWEYTIHLLFLYTLWPTLIRIFPAIPWWFFNHFRDASSRYYYRGDILQNPEYNLLDIYVFPITHLPRNIISCVILYHDCRAKDRATKEEEIISKKKIQKTSFLKNNYFMLENLVLCYCIFQ